MADRASSRGARGPRANRGSDRGDRSDRSRGSRGGGGGRNPSRGGGGGAGAGGENRTTNAPEKRKENILDLSKYMDKEIRVRFNGGREVTGTLKGYDQLMNLVLDNVKEATRDEEGNLSSRQLGLLVARGTLLVLISPVDGSEEIENPFLQPDE